MADPVISNIPTSFTSDQAAFLQDVKASVEFLLGHGRNLAANRALRVGELANMGIDINAFLHGTPQSPHLPFESIPSGDMPDPPTGLLIQKGLFSHTLTWTNPTDTNVSHIEVWVAVNSQNIIDASLIAIVTVTPDLRGGEGKYINAGFDVTADMTYWIRSVSYGDVYSEWHPTLVMGGVTVAGNESVSETIDGVINLLKGGTPELYSDVTVYSLYERCRTADGRVWESISIADHSGNQPPNATYWKRAGILMTGDVDGVPTAAIDGNLVVDDTILARHIQAGSIVAEHMAANQILVGHTIKSDDFVTGVSGWQIDGVGGTAEFNNITMTLSYSNVTGGPPADADKTGSNTAYDTARVNGTAASTVKTNAANGAYIYSNAGALAYKNLVGTAQLDSTIISGGYIKTSLLQVSDIIATGSIMVVGDTAYDTARVAGTAASTVKNNAAAGATFTSSSYVTNTQAANITTIMGGAITTSKISATGGGYYDLTNSKIYFPSSASAGFIYFGSSSNYIIGNSTTGIELRSAIANVALWAKGGVKIVLVGDDYSFQPDVDIGCNLGTTTRKWNWGRFAAVSTNLNAQLDTLDDLQTLHAIKPTDTGIMDFRTIPKRFTTYDDVFKTVKKDNGKLMQDWEIEAELMEKDGIGDNFVGLNLGAFVALIEGAVRQLDRENSATQFEILEWINSLEGRMKTIETRKKG
jgi:hypothetical protein